MRCGAQQNFPFAQCGADQAELPLLEIAQAAMNEFRRRRRGARGEIALLDQDDTKPAAGGVAGDAGAVDTAADYGEIEVGH